MKYFSKFTFTLAILAITYSGISSAENTKPCAHTWHKVHVSQGKWNAALQVINEAEHVWLVDSNCTKTNSLEVTAGTPEIYGLVFDRNADFNMAYTLTVVEQNQMPSFMRSTKACVFVVTANGPAQPDIHPIAYNNAKCNWVTVPGVGEDFFVE